MKTYADFTSSGYSSVHAKPERKKGGVFTGTDDVYVSLEEQETVIRIGRSDKLASIWTSDQTMITKLDKFFDATRTDMGGSRVIARYYEIDKRLVAFRSKRREGKPMSDEQKAKLRAGRVGK